MLIISENVLKLVNVVYDARYSCIHLKICSFWVAFGVFVSRIFFETACFVTFLLISYGYCIMQEQLSLAQRRSAASLTSLLYLILTGYKAAVPQFAVSTPHLRCLIYEECRTPDGELS